MWFTPEEKLSIAFLPRTVWRCHAASCTQPPINTAHESHRIVSVSYRRSVGIGVAGPVSRVHTRAQCRIEVTNRASDPYSSSDSVAAAPVDSSVRSVAVSYFAECCRVVSYIDP